MRRASHLLLLLSLACGDDDQPDRPIPEPAAPLTEPVQLCRKAQRGQPCRSVEEVEGWLKDPGLQILGADQPPAGIQGAMVLTLRVPRPRPVVFRAKWRAHSTTSSRNSPRRELASYAVQKLFLARGDFVVPPTAPYCFPLDHYQAAVDAKATATFPSSSCVYGILSYWLEDVQSLASAREAGWFHGQHRHAFDPQLFARNAAYRDSIARVNLLTYLIGHADSHGKNFVITSDSAAPVVYSVDNSLSLGLAKNPKLGPEHDWSRLQVPKLPRDALERLREAVEDIDSLATVAELAPRGDRLVAVEPREGQPTHDGMDWANGRLRVGLTANEIGDIEVRAALLLRRMDKGELDLY